MLRGLRNISTFPLMHLKIDPTVIHSFKWINIDRLIHHEKTQDQNQNRLHLYFKRLQEKGRTPTVPAIIACAKTYTIIDGHHRASIFKNIQLKDVPVIFVNYEHPDIIVKTEREDVDTICKKNIIHAAKTKQKMEPKQTSHEIISLDGTYHPIVTISPNCSIIMNEYMY